MNKNLVDRQDQNSEYVHLVLEDGILIAEYAKDLEITLAIAEDCVKRRLTLVDQKSYPTLADITHIKGTDKEAREYLSSDMAMQGVSAGAILVSSAFSTMIGNFYLKIAYDKPIPTRLFSEKSKAIKWLQRYKEV